MGNRSDVIKSDTYKGPKKKDRSIYGLSESLVYQKYETERKKK